MIITILVVTSPVVINVPTRGLFVVETKDSFVLWLAKFKYQKICLQALSIAIARSQEASALRLYKVEEIWSNLDGPTISLAAYSHCSVKPGAQIANTHQRLESGVTNGNEV